MATALLDGELQQAFRGVCVLLTTIRDQDELNEDDQHPHLWQAADSVIQRPVTQHGHVPSGAPIAHAAACLGALATFSYKPPSLLNTMIVTSCSATRPGGYTIVTCSKGSAWFALVSPEGMCSLQQSKQT